MNSLKIIWLSANKFGYELLKESVKIKDVEIENIITLSDKSKTVMYDGIPRNKWYNFKINVIEIENINDEVELLQNLSPDIIIMCGWRQVLKKEILDIPRYGMVGFHPTLLPFGRGPSPIINSILNGVRQTGVTMFYVSEGKDDGDIIGQEKFIITNKDHADDVYNKVIKSGKKLIRSYLPMLLKGSAPRIPQEESKATFFPKLSLENNRIDFKNETIEEIYKKIRALSKPYNGAYLEKNGKRLVIWKAELAEK